MWLKYATPRPQDVITPLDIMMSFPESLPWQVNAFTWCRQGKEAGENLVDAPSKKGDEEDGVFVLYDFLPPILLVSLPRKYRLADAWHERCLVRAASRSSD